MIYDESNFLKIVKIINNLLQAASLADFIDISCDVIA